VVANRWQISKPAVRLSAKVADSARFPQPDASLSCVRLITTLSLNFTSRTTRLGPANNGSRQPATGSSSSTRWLTFVAAAAATATAAHQQQQQLQQQSDIHTLILACCISQIAGVIVSHLHCTAKMLQKVICLENS